MGVVIKTDKDWRGVWRPQVAMHSKLPHFLVKFYVIFLHLGTIVHVSVVVLVQIGVFVCRCHHYVNLRTACRLQVYASHRRHDDTVRLHNAFLGSRPGFTVRLSALWRADNVGAFLRFCCHKLTQMLHQTHLLDCSYIKSNSAIAERPRCRVALEATNAVHLRLIGKRVVDFLFVIMELFELGVRLRR